MRFRIPSVFIFGASVCAALLAAGVHASPQSEALTKEGNQLLQKMDAAGALAKFQQAAASDPKDANALFFTGVAYNRLGKGREALDNLRAAMRGGSKRVDLNLEGGWALVLVEEWQKALAPLEQYEKDQPGRARTQNLLGQAYLGLGKLEEAKKAFALSAQRDAQFKPIADLYLAQIAMRQGNDKELTARIQGILRDAPESSVARELRQQLGAAVAPARPPAKPFNLGVAFGIGYTGDSIGHDGDITRKSAGFERLAIAPSYTFRPDDRSALTFGYGLAVDVYNGVSTANFQDHALSADYTRGLSSSLGLRLRGTTQFTYLGGSPFRNGYALNADLGWRLDPASALIFSVGGVKYDYRMTPVIAAQNRDGNQALLGVGYTRALGADARLRVGYLYANYHADGQDFSSRSNGVNAGITANLGNRVTGDIGIYYSHDRYDNPNSVAAFLFGRKDNISGVTAQLSRPIDNTWRVFVQAGYAQTNSNISFYQYNQTTALTGVAAAF